MLKGLGGSRERSSLGHLWAATDGTGGQQMHLQHVLQTCLLWEDVVLVQIFFLNEFDPFEENRVNFLNYEVAY